MKTIVATLFGISGAILISLPAAPMLVCAANACWIVADLALIYKLWDDPIVYLFIVYLLCAILGVVNNIGWMI